MEELILYIDFCTKKLLGALVMVANMLKQPNYGDSSINFSVFY